MDFDLRPITDRGAPSATLVSAAVGPAQMAAVEAPADRFDRELGRPGPRSSLPGPVGPPAAGLAGLGLTGLGPVFQPPSRALAPSRMGPT